MKIIDVNSMGRVFLSVGISAQESEELILNESQILRTFNHPNIVQLECTFIEDCYLISCLEYLDSDDLYSYVTRYAMNTKQIQNLFCQLCSAVSYCHSQMVSSVFSCCFIVLLFFISRNFLFLVQKSVLCVDFFYWF